MSRKQPFSPQEFEAIYSTVTRATVEVIVCIDHQVLLLEREEQSWHGQWHIPGGTIFYKETVQAAIHRIAQEELGFDVEVGNLLGYIEYPSEEQERGFGWSIGLAFLCSPKEKPNTFQFPKNAQLFQTLPDNLVVEQRTILEKVLGDLRENLR